MATKDDILEGQWAQLKGQVKEKWGKLTDDDIQKIEGKRDRLEGKLRERYGYDEPKAKKEVESLTKEVSSLLKVSLLGIDVLDVLPGLNEKLSSLTTMLTSQFDKLAPADIKAVTQPMSSPGEAEARQARLGKALQEKYGWDQKKADDEAQKVFAKLGITAKATATKPKAAAKPKA